MVRMAHMTHIDFDKWYESTKQELYKSHYIKNKKLVNEQLFKTEFLTNIVSIDQDLIRVIRYSFMVPISADRLKYKGTSLESIENIIYTRPFLWKFLTNNEIAIPIIIDRLVLSDIDRCMRKALEQRQVNIVKTYLNNKNFKETKVTKKYDDITRLPKGCYTEDYRIKKNKQLIKIDIAVNTGKCIYFMELKSATDYSNTSKRAKEEEGRLNRIKNMMKDTNIVWKKMLILSGYFTKEFMKNMETKGIVCAMTDNLDKIGTLLTLL